MGCEVIEGPPVSQPEKGYTEEQLIEICKDVDAFMGMAREKVTRRVIQAGNRLRIICKYGNGVDNIDIAAATEHGVLVANAPVHNNTVAEFTFAITLSLLKKIPYSMGYLKNGGWRDSTTIGYELYKKTFGIVGLGGIGKQLAKRLQGWECEIITYDPFISRETAELLGARLVGWEELFTRSDIVTLHLPLTESTRGIVGAKEFGMMKNTAVLINASRGPIVDEAALIQALQEKRIAGAALDVFQKEPLDPTNPLLQMDNVVLTPHVAGFTYESMRRISEQSTANCLAALKGEIPEFVVNREAIPIWKERFLK